MLGETRHLVARQEVLVLPHNEGFGEGTGVVFAKAKRKEKKSLQAAAVVTFFLREAAPISDTPQSCPLDMELIQFKLQGSSSYSTAESGLCSPACRSLLVENALLKIWLRDIGVTSLQSWPNPTSSPELSSVPQRPR